MRFVILGTGAIGGVVGARLSIGGNDVVAIARGRQLEAISRGGLTLRSPRETITVDLPVVAEAADVGFREDDVVLLTVKSQDTHSAIAELAKHAAASTPVFCVQNGVANERTVMRRFRAVYGVVVMMPATFVEPGEVSVYGEPLLGAIDVGRFPAGVDHLATEFASRLASAGFSSRAVDDIMRWKYGKLIGNLTNAIEAVCGLGTRNGELGRLVTREGQSVLTAAGIAFVPEEEEDARRSGLTELWEAGGVKRQGASSWQSLIRGSGSIETDYINGEISLLGRLHGVPTPANDALQDAATRIATGAGTPGSMTERQLLDALE